MKWSEHVGFLIFPSLFDTYSYIWIISVSDSGLKVFQLVLLSCWGDGRLRFSFVSLNPDGLSISCSTKHHVTSRPMLACCIKDTSSSHTGHHIHSPCTAPEAQMLYYRSAVVVFLCRLASMKNLTFRVQRQKLETICMKSSRLLSISDS